MQNLSDIIEDFILNSLSDSDSLNLSRNELANYFNVSPSQINYVLTTRFTLDRGFLVESKRGGGGYIKLSKLELEKNNYLSELIKNLSNSISYNNSCYILNNLVDLNIINTNEEEIIKSAISPKTLQTPFPIEDTLRSKIFKNILIGLMNRRD